MEIFTWDHKEGTNSLALCFYSVKGSQVKLIYLSGEWHLYLFSFFVIFIILLCIFWSFAIFLWTASSLQDVAATPMTYTTFYYLQKKIKYFICIFFSFATLSWCLLSTMYPQQPSLNLTLLSIVILFGLPFLSISYFIFIQSKFFFPNLVIMKYFCNQMINFCGVKILFESHLWGSWTAQNPMEVHWQLSSTLKSGGFLSVFLFQFFF